MLQINVEPYASDAIEDACRLAHTDALNSYSFSDMLNYLNYTWADMYKQLALFDEGYYSKTIRLRKKLTKLPPYVKNSVRVYAAQQPNMYNREIFRASGYNDLNGWNTYHISGFDLYCPDAERRAVWLNYVPQEPMIFFTRNNRDPKLYLDKGKLPTKVTSTTQNYNLWQIGINSIVPGINTYYVNVSLDDLSVIQKSEVRFTYRNAAAAIADVLGTQIFTFAAGYVDGSGADHPPEWSIRSFICDYPYLFVTYKHNVTGEHYSGFYHNLPDDSEWIEYNPFAFTGRNSNVEYLQAKWNDKTGLGVIVKDYNDFRMLVDNVVETPTIKEMGWTPDTLLHYPAPEMYRLLVARLADKFAALNESSNLMGVAKELSEAEAGFKGFIGKDKSAWQRIDNVNGPSIGDWL